MCHMRWEGAVMSAEMYADGWYATQAMAKGMVPFYMRQPEVTHAELHQNGHGQWAVAYWATTPIAAWHSTVAAEVASDRRQRSAP